MALFECHQCGGTVGEGARACPHCGGWPYPRNPQNLRQQLVVVLILAIILAAVLTYQLLGIPGL